MKNIKDLIELIKENKNFCEDLTSNENIGDKMTAELVGSDYLSGCGQPDWSPENHSQVVQLCGNSLTFRYQPTRYVQDHYSNLEISSIGGNLCVPINPKDFEKPFMYEKFGDMERALLPITHPEFKRFRRTGLSLIRYD